MIVREVGNVTADTELTYEYGICTEKQAKKKSKQTGLIPTCVPNTNMCACILLR